MTEPVDPVLLELAEASSRLALSPRDWREKVDGNCPRHGSQLFSETAQEPFAPCWCFEASVIRALLKLPDEVKQRLHPMTRKQLGIE